MDKKDIIYDVIANTIGDIFTGHIVEEMSIEICKELGICEKCGAKLKGED